MDYILELPSLNLPLGLFYKWANSFSDSDWTQIVDGPHRYDYYEIRNLEIGTHKYSQQIMKAIPLPLDPRRVALHKMIPGSKTPIHTDHAFSGPPRKSVLIAPFQIPCDGASYYSCEKGHKRLFQSRYQGPVIIRGQIPHDVMNSSKINRYTIQFSLNQDLDEIADQLKKLGFIS